LISCYPANVRAPTFSRGLALACAAVLSASVASAQKPDATKPAPAAAAKKEAKPAAVDVAPAVKKLESGDPEQIRSALDDLRIAGPGAAAAGPAVAKVLAHGLTLPLTETAIETLADLESEAGSAAIAPYAQHRNLKVRRAAVKALARTKGAAAGPALRRALSDADPVIRGTAASGLGALKAKDAVGDLFVALDHKVNEAAASIGQLCAPEQCDQLATKLGKMPFDVVSGALDQVLFRPDMSEDAKIKVIGRVRELGTIEANKFLRDVQQRWPQTGSKRVRQSIDQAVIATSGGTQ
jgi:HEAT repeat protein